MGKRFEKSLEEKQKFFDRHAQAWDEENRLEQDKLAELVGELGLAPGDVVVEPGCGTGLVSSLILKIIGESGRLLAADVSRLMLEQAEKKHLFPNVSFQHADAGRLPFPDAAADAVVCFRVFPHLDDKSGALREFNRVLKSGGRLAIAHASGRDSLNEYHAGVGGEVATDMLPDRTELIRLLALHGFELHSLTDRDDRYLALAVKQRPLAGGGENTKP
ncbi:MAG TPA: methyltransferase domain-containing protein [Candidatus Glassbacteria bacterium]|nr:methyltransferase domain-containing protein [Candidatus Glassbacteria bacterium]